MTQTIKAIETEYAGCRFRSRLEARWAVFFDHLGIAWNFEPQGFEVDGVRYLPDFELPGLGRLIVEVKGCMEAADMRKVLTLAVNHVPVLVLQEIPRPDERGPHFLLFLTTTAEGLVVRRVSFAPYWDGWTLKSHGQDEGPADLAVDWALGLFDSPLPSTPSAAGADLHSMVVGAAFAAARSARFEHGEHG